MPAYGNDLRFGAPLTPAVKRLIIANVAVFFLQAFLGDVIIKWFAFIPREAVFGLQLWRFFTYMFLHGGFTHIAFNMFGLWMFGSPIERLWGSRPFLIYYFICGLGGALTYGLFNLVGMNSFIPMLGASGALFGILLAYALSFPDSILLVAFIIPMKAKYAVALFGLVSLLSMPGGGSIAHMAHLGGMLTGYLYLQWTIPSMRSRRFGFNELSALWRRYRTKRGIHIVKPGQKNSGPDQGQNQGAQQKDIDKILDKISRQGLQSLTDREQEILRKAGRR